MPSKVHRLVRWNSCMMVCGRNEWEPGIRWWNRWMGVTCKKCLDKRPKRVTMAEWLGPKWRKQ